MNDPVIKNARKKMGGLGGGGCTLKNCNAKHTVGIKDQMIIAQENLK